LLQLNRNIIAAYLGDLILRNFPVRKRG